MTQSIRPVVVGSNPAVQRIAQTQLHLQPQPAATLASKAPFNPGSIAAASSPALSAPPPGNWHPPSSAEIKEAFSRSDKIFAKHLNEAPEAKKWLENLTQCLAEKKMEPQHKGVEMFIRFKAAYSDIHHVGYSTMWRDQKGKLKVEFMHQESMPPTPETKINTGKFFNTYDTAHVLGGKAPVDQSMDLAGLPDINAFPVEDPHQLEGVNVFLNHPDTIHPYGLFEGYSKGLPGEPEIRHINCFAATEMAADVVRGGEFAYPRDNPAPNCLIRLGDYACTDVKKTLSQFVVEKEMRQLDKIAEYPLRVGIKMCVHIGRIWGEDAKWDVPGRLSLKPSAATIPPGGTISLAPNAHAVKIMSNPKGITLDGKPLKRQPYAADQVAKMQNSGTTPIAVKFLYSVPTPDPTTPRAKL